MAVASFPSRSRPKTLTFSMAKTLTFLTDIDTSHGWLAVHWSTVGDPKARRCVGEGDSHLLSPVQYRHTFTSLSGFIHVD